MRQPEVNYCILKGDGCWYSDTLKTFDGNEDNQRTVQMDEAYLDEFGPTVTLRLKQAGFRLASVIERALNP